MKEEDRVIYTREELAEKVQVPAIVEQDLKRIIGDKLEQCGLYFRVFSRTKTAASMEKKFESKEYGGDRKIQDLVGIRINLYFDDDVEICKDIMEHIFEVIEWSASERSEEEFKPTKMNGVFRLPMYLRNRISPETWDMSIDDTFEVQIKTMFFEGWHEIEHDMRYKGDDIWHSFPGFSRYFNSILATLELCDKSVINLFEDLGHALYKEGRWSDMIKSHYRLKLGDAQLYPEVVELFDEEKRNKVSGSLAKKTYKTNKQVVVEQLLLKNKKIPINVNTIIAILNDKVFHDPRLTAIFRAHDVYNDGREESLAESRHYELRPLNRHNVFQMYTRVDGNRMKIQPMTSDQLFERTAECIYRWIVQKYSGLFVDMPKQVTTYRADIMAYHVMVNYDKAQHRMNMHVRHMDMELGGRIWYSEANLSENEEHQLYLKMVNGYAEPSRDNTQHENSGMFFSYPGYYKAIVDTVGIQNGMECSNRRRILREDNIRNIADCIQNKERTFPVVLILSKENEEGWMDEEWLDQFRVSDFTKTVWRYAHVFTGTCQMGQQVLQCMEDTAEIEADEPQMILFWPDGAVDSYGPEDVRNCSFGRHVEINMDTKTYATVRGGQAFYHKIVTDLRDWNVSADMWEGFEMEIRSNLPS